MFFISNLFSLSFSIQILIKLFFIILYLIKLLHADDLRILKLFIGFQIKILIIFKLLIQILNVKRIFLITVLA